MNRLHILKVIALIVIANILCIANALADGNSTLTLQGKIGAPIVVGHDYTILDNPKIGHIHHYNTNKVNVKEFFSFTCIHCKEVDPLVETQLANNQKIELNKIQVVWDNTTNEYAKLNATIQSMNLTRLYVPAFNAIFDGIDLTNQQQLRQFLLQNGLSTRQSNKFLLTYNSFAVSSRAVKERDLTAKYGIVGTPTFIINDKYMVSPASPERLIEVVKFLIAKQP